MDNDNKRAIKATLITIFAIAFAGLILFLILNASLGNPMQKATNNDIDGHWNSTLTEHTFVFIPKSNINDLEVTFSIRDDKNNELQKIVKKVGDVKKGEQYTVSFNVSELKDFATLMDASLTKLTVTGGTKQL